MTPAPYNTATPFTAEDVARFNRLTNFPKDLAKENAAFAAESQNARERAVRRLNAFGVSSVPEEIERALERVRKARYQVFMASVRSRELAPPWSVVGPARWNEHARPERAQRVMCRAYDEYNAAKAALEQRLNRQGPARTIRSDEATAVAQLEAKIAAAEERQMRMKSANRIIRDANVDETWKLSRLETECGIKETYARQLLKPDFAGRTGFAEFELSNNSANIRRMQDRVRSLVAEAGRESVTFHFPGGRVEDNAESCRVRIRYDEKPAAEVIGRLKSHGFHWSPREEAWQRLRNNAARHAATVVTGVQWPRADTPEINALAEDDRLGPAKETTKAVRIGVGP
ncbi:MAG: hypothetical protein Q8M02_13325 [Candidatus Didemnitutus sp.]|nr:hypothetical protein [Candidatus Didemnitutus sp.]